MKKKKKKTRAQIVAEQEQKVLSDMITCGTTCGDLKKPGKLERDFTVAEIDELLRDLPGVDYVLRRMLNYIFSNGLTTGQESDDKAKLDPWLYERKNRSGATNYEVLKAVIGQALVYGECGLRLYDGNLYAYKRGTFGTLLSEEDGISEVVGYFIREDGKPIEKDMDTSEWDVFSQWTNIYNYFDEYGMIFLDPTEFVAVRNDTTYLHGYSPFERDQERLDLLSAVYERLNYDINYDGTGRIVLRPKDGFITGDDNDVSTGAILDNSIGAQEQRNEDAQREIRRVAEAIKESSSDSVILLSNAFSDKIEHLPRVTKATEFFTWLEQDTVIIAQILGMSPTLLEVGKLHGNVSVEKIIDNAMLNTIIPIREGFAVQFSKLIADHLKVEKIYFDKYDLEQIQDENEMRAKVASMIKDLSTAQKASPSDNLGKLIDEVTNYLRSSIYDDNGNARTL